MGFKYPPIKVWATGIDTEEFFPSNNTIKEYVLVYHKMRSKKEFNQIIKILQNLKIKYYIIEYRKYKESDYKDVLKKSKFVIWHGRHESQGIALQEAMACDVPILVCDVTSVFQEVNGYNWPENLREFEVTSAPYFDDRCGKKLFQ